MAGFYAPSGFAAKTGGATDPGSVALADSQFQIQLSRLTLSNAERLVLAVTARFCILDFTAPTGRLVLSGIGSP